MAKKRSDRSLTPLELEVMKVLWSSGPSTVQAVHAQIQSVRPLAFNTVQTVLGILFRKEKVKRVMRDRAYVYRAAVSRDAAAGRALKDLIDRVFHSQPEEVVLSMVRNRHITPAQLAALQHLVTRGGEEGDDDERS